MRRLMLLLTMIFMAQFSFSQITASHGLTRVGNNIRLGQNGANPAGNAALPNNRFIPTNDFFIILTDVLSTRSTSLGGRFITQTDSFSNNTSHLIPGKADFNGPEGTATYTFNGWDMTRVVGGSLVTSIRAGNFESEAFLEIVDQINNNPKIRLNSALIENNNNVFSLSNSGGSSSSFAMDFNNNQARFASGFVDPDAASQFFQVFGSAFISDSLILPLLPEGTVTDSLVVWDEGTKALRRIDMNRLPSNTLQRVSVNDANYAATSSNYLIGYTAISTGRTVTLPAASTMTNKTIIVKDESGNAGTSNITVDGDGSETIDGAATKVINVGFGSITVYSNGTNWFVLSTTGGLIL
jgi:hypothetical protein